MRKGLPITVLEGILEKGIVEGSRSHSLQLRKEKCIKRRKSEFGTQINGKNSDA